MAYEPQPGTIPHRAVAWLRAMENLSPDRWYTTPELCAALDLETPGFTAYMQPCRAHGTVQTQQRPDTGKLLWWRIGDGTPPACEVAQYDARVEATNPGKRTDLGDRQPLVDQWVPPQPRPGFRAVEWDGHLITTGMEIRDGVAIFTPDQVLQLKRRTDWWGAQA